MTNVGTYFVLSDRMVHGKIPYLSCEAMIHCPSPDLFLYTYTRTPFYISCTSNLDVVKKDTPETSRQSILDLFALNTI